MDVIAEKIKASSQAFVDHVWPQVSELLGGGRILPVEATKDAQFFAQLLDTYSGIDMLHVDDQRSLLRGLATRNQRTKKLFETITIRFSRPGGHDVEFHKRLRALNEPEYGWMCPALIIHSYFTPDYASLRATAIAPVRDVIRLIVEGEQGPAWYDPRDWYLDVTSANWGNNDNTAFAVIPIETLSRHGIKHKWIVFE